MNQTTKKERISYGIFFFGQNVLWAYAGLVSTYLLDIGLDAKTASAILLIPKIWDAINDTLFGYFVDRCHFRNNEKLLPWIRIGTSLIGISVIFMYSINRNIDNQTIKILWFIIAYIIFDGAYTMLDAPAYALPTAMTTNIQERTELISSNRLWGMLGGAFGTILIPLLRPKTGWLWGAIIFCGFASIFMLPLLFTGKERNIENEHHNSYGFKEMFRYIKENRYLFMSLLMIFVVGLCSVESNLSLIVARNCLGSETMSTVITAIASFPIVLLSPFIPKLCKKYDKKNVLLIGMFCGLIGSLLSYITGYDNLVLLIITLAIRGIGLSLFTIISYMLVADSVEYGTYKSGIRAPGISFSLQTFTAKLKNALIASLALFALGLFGYDSTLPETVSQAPDVIEGIYKVFCLVPALGYLSAIIILLFFYKLTDKDTETMARYNNHEISKEEALDMLESKYGRMAE